MTVALDSLLDTANNILQPERFRDYCPNGLQVEGRPRVGKLVSGVTACQALLDAAVAEGADAILVHHGYFWRGDDPVVTGIRKRRLATLLANDVSLIAYHLPLDAHPEFGNNATLGRLLGIQTEDSLDPADPGAVGNIGHFDVVRPVADVLEDIGRLLGREALHIGDGEARVKRVAWCSGAAQSYIEQAIAAGADLFISGEISEQTVHLARESGIHYIAAGHHATERYGVQALGEHLAEQLGLEHRFIDIDNPV